MDHQESSRARSFLCPTRLRTGTAFVYAAAALSSSPLRSNANPMLPQASATSASARKVSACASAFCAASRLPDDPVAPLYLERLSHNFIDASDGGASASNSSAKPLQRVPSGAMA